MTQTSAKHSKNSQDLKFLTSNQVSGATQFQSQNDEFNNSQYLQGQLTQIREAERQAYQAVAERCNQESRNVQSGSEVLAQ